MELWVRSQDKCSLIKVNKLTFEWNIDNEPKIYDYEKYDNYEKLGIYKSKERALEVLDEIQNLIDDISDGKCVGCVYIMPKE